MRPRWTGRSMTVLAFAVVNAVALAGVAAATSSSGPTITVCVHHKGGGLYKASKCAHSDKTLSWNAHGVPGAPGATGAAGPAGAQGVQGNPGPITGALPSGVTLTGSWTIVGPAPAGGDVMETSISFPLQPASAPTVVILAPGASPTTQCPGSVTNPEAEAGFLCVYEVAALNGAVSDVNPTSDGDGSASQFGVDLNETSLGAGDFNAGGTWALTGG